MQVLIEKLKEAGIGEKELQAIDEAIQAKAEELSEKKLEEKKAEIQEAIEEKVKEYAEKFDAYLSEEIIPVVEAKYKESFELEASTIVEDFTKKFDAYSQYIVEQLEENDVTQSGLKVAMAEELIKAIRDVYSEYSVELPEGENLEESLAESIEESEKKIQDVIKENAELKKQLIEMKKEKMIESVADEFGMTAMQKEALADVASEMLFIEESVYLSKLKKAAGVIASGAKKVEEKKEEYHGTKTEVVTEKVDASAYSKFIKPSY